MAVAVAEVVVVGVVGELTAVGHLVVMAVEVEDTVVAVVVAAAAVVVVVVVATAVVVATVAPAAQWLWGPTVATALLHHFLPLTPEVVAATSAPGLLAHLLPSRCVHRLYRLAAASVFQAAVSVAVVMFQAVVVVAAVVVAAVAAVAVAVAAVAAVAAVVAVVAVAVVAVAVAVGVWRWTSLPTCSRGPCSVQACRCSRHRTHLQLHCTLVAAVASCPPATPWAASSAAVCRR